MRISTENSNKDLLVRIIQGDDEAFTMLYQRYHDSIYAISLRFIKDPDAAQDIVQHVFLRVWENREKLSLDLNLRNYLITTAVNKIKNYVRDNNVAIRGNYEWAQMRLSNANILTLVWAAKPTPAPTSATCRYANGVEPLLALPRCHCPHNDHPRLFLSNQEITKL